MRRPRTSISKLERARDAAGLYAAVAGVDERTSAAAAESLAELVLHDEPSATALADAVLAHPAAVPTLLAHPRGAEVVVAALNASSPETRRLLANRVVDSCRDQLTDYLSPVRLLLASSVDEVQEAVDAAFEQAWADAERKARRVLQRGLPWSAEDLAELWWIPVDAAKAIASALDRDAGSFDHLIRDVRLCRVLVRAIETGDPYGERAGSRGLRVILGRIGNPRAQRGPGDDYPFDVRHAANKCLGALAAKHGATPAELKNADMESLIERLELAYSARGDIVAELGRRADPTSVVPLLGILREALGDGDRRLTDSVTKALVAVGRSDARALVRGMEDEDAGVRWVVANALADVGGLDIVPDLEAALDDPDEYVRYAITSALERINARG